MRPIHMLYLLLIIFTMGCTFCYADEDDRKVINDFFTLLKKDNPTYLDYQNFLNAPEGPELLFEINQCGSDGTSYSAECIKLFKTRAQNPKDHPSFFLNWLKKKLNTENYSIESIHTTSTININSNGHTITIIHNKSPLSAELGGILWIDKIDGKPVYDVLKKNLGIKF